MSEIIHAARPGSPEPGGHHGVGLGHPHVGVTETFVGMPKFPKAARHEMALSLIHI